MLSSFLFFVVFTMTINQHRLTLWLLSLSFSAGFRAVLRIIAFNLFSLSTPPLANACMHAKTPHPRSHACPQIAQTHRFSRAPSRVRRSVLCTQNACVFFFTSLLRLPILPAVFPAPRLSCIGRESLRNVRRNTQFAREHCSVENFCTH